MTRLHTFVTAEELEHVRLMHKLSGMWTSSGMPIGDPAWEVEQLRKTYHQPEGTGLDLSNGEFVFP